MSTVTQAVEDAIIEMYGDKEMRWYQIAARNQAIQALENNVSRILIVQPTGSGKTLTIVSSLSHPDFRKALGVTGNRPVRVLFVAHKHRLLTQAENTFVDGCNVELVTQSMFSDIPKEVLDAGWDVCILDESHHESCMSFQLQLEEIGDKPVIGLTATPDRADGCVIKFEVIINPISREQAVAEGWLAETELNTFVDTPTRDKTEVIKDMINTYGHEMRQTMVFVRTKAEVQRISDFLNESGYVSVALTNQSEKQLDVILDQFSAGDIQFIVNCSKINEGVDVVGCTDVILGRQFGSYPQLNQVIGRAARPDSECRVWELVNPLSGTNLDTTVVVGTPKTHRLIAKSQGEWIEREFDYTAHSRAIDDSLTMGRTY
jgi:superfamily II DNA or RNA helicase